MGVRLVWLALGLLPGTAGALTLTAGDWPAPRRAEALTAHAPLRALLHSLDAQPGCILVVRHAGGEAGSAFAAALRDALVALGVPSARVALEPAAAGRDQLIVEIVDNGK
jgi:hypothetical protein